MSPKKRKNFITKYSRHGKGNYKGWQWKDFSHYWIGKKNIVIMNMLLKLVYRFNKMPFKLSICFTSLENKQPWNSHRATNNHEETK